MVEAAGSANEIMEYEVRGGLWEGVHAVIFYAAVACAVLATAGVMRLAMGVACVALLFYSIFTIFSSPTYVMIDPSAREVTVERYHYFIPSRRRVKRGELERLVVVEAPRPPVGEGEKGSRRDLSYYVRVYLELKGGERLKIFRSGMTGAPSENRGKAFLITQSAASALDLAVAYTRSGGGRGPEEK